MRPVPLATFREVVAHYQGIVRLRDREIELRYAAKLPTGPGEDRVYAETDDDDLNRHRFVLTVSRAALYLPTERLIEIVLHELAHIFLWPLNAEDDAEHDCVEKLALVWASTLPLPDVLRGR